ncbi:unnamed protein product [Caenorhabditis sp. 36 PRJEB53466]|nr:unnamed protein product [Caenorhabditis sp. 36 PRJEB53466]
MTSEKELTVSTKVLMGNGKFREFRMPGTNTSEANPLWTNRHEVGKRISEVMLKKRSEINSCKKLITLLEKSCDNWKSVAKLINRSNEDFFLTALNGSQEAIDAFEKENFSKSNSWTQLKDVSELTGEERMYLFSIIENGDDDEDITFFTKQSSHYEWMCHQTNDVAMEQSASADKTDSHDHVIREMENAADLLACNKQQTVKDEKTAVLTEIKKIDTTPADEVKQESCSTDVVETPTLTKVDVVFSTLQNGDAVEGVSSAEESTPAAPQEAKDNASVSIPKVSVPQPSARVANAPGEKPDVVSKVKPAKRNKFKRQKDASAAKLPENSQINYLTESSPTNTKSIPNTISTLQLSPIIISNNQVDGKEPPAEAPIEPNESRSLQKEPSEKKEEIAISSTEITESQPNDSNGAVATESNARPKTKFNVDAPAFQPARKLVSIPEPISSDEPTSDLSVLEQPKKHMADPSGFSRLRLTSGSSSKDDEPESTPVAQKKFENIWEQRAAEREQKQKLMADKTSSRSSQESTSRQSSVSICSASQSVIPPVQNLKTNSVNEPVTPEPQGNQNGNGVPQKGKKEASKQPAKKIDSNGWITLNTKKATAKESVLMQLTEAPSASSSSSRPAKKEANQPTPSQLSPALSGSPSTVTEKNGKQEVPIPSTAESSQLDKETSLTEQEKRAKRRQRVQEKTKQEAKLKKEEDQKVKEQRTIERDKRIEEEKRMKEQRKRERYERQRQEIARIKEEREAQARPKPSLGRFNEMVDCKLRVSTHVKEKSLDYRLIGSKLYIEKRLQEITPEHDDNLEINMKKGRILMNYRTRIANIEAMNCFMVFVNHIVVDKIYPIKLADLLEYLHNKSHSIPNETKTPLQRRIYDSYEKFYLERQPKDSENMAQAIKFTEGVLDRIAKMGADLKEDMKKTKQILIDYKKTYNKTMKAINTCSYLLTRVAGKMFVVEEDYLLTIHANNGDDFDESDVSEEEVGHESSSRNSSEMNGETRVMQDTSCQAEFDSFDCDVRAASYLPKSN